MKLLDLKKIKKQCFGVEDISRVLGISHDSARVTASRYAAQGILLRLKKNTYILKDAWDAFTKEDKFRLANIGQVPSYISLMTALDYYQVITQMQQDVFESVAIKRSKEIELGGNVFRYIKIARELYQDFRKEKGFFIATPEKALLDACYLISYGRYTLDMASLDVGKLDLRKIRRLSRVFPVKTKNFLKRYEYF